MDLCPWLKDWRQLVKSLKRLRASTVDYSRSKNKHDRRF